MFSWKITKLESKDGKSVDNCHYQVRLNDGKNIVETEGNWYFSKRIITKAFDELTEQDIIDLVKEENSQDNVCAIESRLKEQMNTLNDRSENHLPWLPQVFTPNN